jgi:hypothetical protein
MVATQYLTVPHLDRATLTRLFSKITVDPVTQCWLWTGALAHGYGQACYTAPRQRKRTVMTHRLMYAWLVAPLPLGLGRDIPPD